MRAIRIFPYWMAKKENKLFLFFLVFQKKKKNCFVSTIIHVRAYPYAIFSGLSQKTENTTPYQSVDRHC